MTVALVKQPQLTMSNTQSWQHLELELSVLLGCFSRRLLLLLLLTLLLHQQIDDRKVQLHTHTLHIMDQPSNMKMQ